MKMLFRLMIVLSLLFSYLFLYEYKIIQRSTIVTANNGAKYQVGDFGNYYRILIYVEKYKNFSNFRTPKKDVKVIAKVQKNRYEFLERKNSIHVANNLLQTEITYK